jgi:hypothetical protein
MIRNRPIASAAALAVGAAAGWFARGLEATPETARPALAAGCTSAPHTATTAGDTKPQIVVSADGPMVAHAAPPAGAVPWAGTTQRLRSGARCTPPAPLDPAAVLRALELGGDAERFESLLRARADEVPVPASTLQQLVETDPSERVRLAAFESWLEARADHGDALRQTLEAALDATSAAIRSEAKQRLDVLLEMQRVGAQPPQGGP